MRNTRVLCTWTSPYGLSREVIPLNSGLQCSQKLAHPKGFLQTQETLELLCVHRWTVHVPACSHTAAVPCLSYIMGAQAGRHFSAQGKNHSAACQSWQMLIILTVFDRPMMTDALCPAQASYSRNLLGVLPNCIFHFKNSYNYFWSNLPWTQQTFPFHLTTAFSVYINHYHISSPTLPLHAKKQFLSPYRSCFLRVLIMSRNLRHAHNFSTQTTLIDRRGRTWETWEHATWET